MHIDCFQPSDEYCVSEKYESIHIKNKYDKTIKSESICDIVKNIVQNIYSMRFLLVPSIGNKE